jgi:hypothetical protein
MCHSVFSLRSPGASILCRLKPRGLLVLASSVLAVCVLFRAGDVLAGGGEDDGVTARVTLPEQTGVSPVPAGAPGLRVYRDPETGQLGPPPPGMRVPALSAKELRMLNRSDRGLQERHLPGGGVAVNLQGRYRNMVVTTIDASGSPTVNCAQTPAQAATILQRGERRPGDTAD